MQINEQYFKDVIDHVLEQSDQIDKITSKLIQLKFKRVYLCGSGGSIARLRCGKRELIKLLNVPIFDTYSAELATDDQYIIDSETVIILGSKTGTTDDLLQACERTKGKGAFIIGFTGTPNCPLNQYLDVRIDSLDTDVNLFLYWLFIVSLRWKLTSEITLYDEYCSWLKSSIVDLVDLLSSKSKEMENMIRLLSPTYQMWVGSGEYINILDCYSKYIMEEIQRIPTQVIHSGEFFHGPFEIVDERQSVFLVIGDQSNREMDIRVKKFLDKTVSSYLLLDLAELKCGKMSFEMKSIVNTIYINYFFTQFKAAYSDFTHKNVSTRRYYRVVDY